MSEFCTTARKGKGREDTYDFTIKIMLSHHDSVDCFRIDKVEEGETSRATGKVVAHDGTVTDLAELGEVAAERIYGRHQPLSRQNRDNDVSAHVQS